MAAAPSSRAAWPTNATIRRLTTTTPKHNPIIRRPPPPAQSQRRHMHASAHPFVDRRITISVRAAYKPGSQSDAPLLRSALAPGGIARRRQLQVKHVVADARPPIPAAACPAGTFCRDIARAPVPHSAPSGSDVPFRYFSVIGSEISATPSPACRSLRRTLPAA